MYMDLIVDEYTDRTNNIITESILNVNQTSMLQIENCKLIKSPDIIEVYDRLERHGKYDHVILCRSTAICHNLLSCLICLDGEEESFDEVFDDEEDDNEDHKKRDEPEDEEDEVDESEDQITQQLLTPKQL